MKNLFLISALMVFGFAVQAQNIRSSVITWTASQSFKVDTGEMKEETNTIISTNSATIEWQKADGATSLFTVSEVVGQWTDVKKNGEIVYEINNDVHRGTITFIKESPGTKIRLLLIEGESQPFIYELTISGYQVQ